MVMRYAQRITKSRLGLLPSRSGKQQKRPGCSRIFIRNEKRPYTVRRIWTVQGRYILFFLGLSQGLQDSLISTRLFPLDSTRRDRSLTLLYSVCAFYDLIDFTGFFIRKVADRKLPFPVVFRLSWNVHSGPVIKTQ